MSSNPAYKLAASVESTAGRHLNDSQLSQLHKTEQYLEKHKIHEICNVRISISVLGTRGQATRDET